MSENAIDSENVSKPAPGTAKPKGARKAGKKAKPTKKASRAKKPAAKPKTDRANKKAEVIEMMKRAKGATLAEIMKATGWQPHTVRGFVSILGRPNAGKSTLLNALLGRKVAIVASRPQTTRTSIQGVLTTPKAQMVFVDTPGIHKSTTLLNKRMMDTVRASAENDVVLFLVDSLARFGDEAERD